MQRHPPRTPDHRYKPCPLPLRPLRRPGGICQRLAQWACIELWSCTWHASHCNVASNPRLPIEMMTLWVSTPGRGSSFTSGRCAKCSASLRSNSFNTPKVIRTKGRRAVPPYTTAMSRISGSIGAADGRLRFWRAKIRPALSSSRVGPARPTTLVWEETTGVQLTCLPVDIIRAQMTLSRRVISSIRSKVRWVAPSDLSLLKRTKGS